MDESRRPLGHALRGAFALEPDLLFLNHGSFGATPRAVLAAREAWTMRYEADPVRFELAERGPRLRALADRLGAWLGAPAGEVVLVDNASTGVAAVLRSLPLRPGDVLVTTDHCYRAVARALEHLAVRAGARVHVVPMPFPTASADETLRAFVSGLPDRAALAVFDQVTSATGLVWPVAEMVAACRDRGIPTLVDGAHAPGMLAVDLAAIGADFWTGNLHKWAFAPKGAAVLHARSRWHGLLLPPTVSNGLVGGGALANEFDYQGTRDPSTWLAAGDALAFGDALGWERLRDWSVAVRDAMALRWCEAWGVERCAPPGMRGALETLPMPDPTVDGLALNRHLRTSEGIQAMFPSFAGRTWFRVSAAAYLEPGDLEPLIAALRRLGVTPRRR